MGLELSWGRAVLQKWCWEEVPPSLPTTPTNLATGQGSAEGSATVWEHNWDFSPWPSPELLCHRAQTCSTVPETNVSVSRVSCFMNLINNSRQTWSIVLEEERQDYLFILLEDITCQNCYHMREHQRVCNLKCRKKVLERCANHLINFSVLLLFCLGAVYPLLKCIVYNLSIFLFVTSIQFYT